MPFTKGQSGNPRGKKVGTYTKPRISDYLNQEEVDRLVVLAKKQASENPKLLIFILEQIFGKARQSHDISTMDITNPENQSSFTPEEEKRLSDGITKLFLSVSA